MFKKIDNLLASFGNMKAMKRVHVDDFTEEKITSVLGEKFGSSEYGELRGEFQELAGYLFFNTTIISATDFKTKKGAFLDFSSETTDFILHSDGKIVESDFSNVSNRYITKIDYSITEDQMKVIKEKIYDNITFRVKKHLISLKK